MTTATATATVDERAHRYAVYFAPATGHPLWQAGCDWLGRDPSQGQPSPPPARAEVVTPWRYGFHATIKAPMRLAEGVSQTQFLEALEDWASQHEPIDLPALEVGLLDDFIALTPKPAQQNYVALRALAADCVRTLDAWRAPLSPPELAHQTRGPLTPRQLENVALWGYAHVMDDWRFHMTLSNTLAATPAVASATLLANAQIHFAKALAEPLYFDAVCVFVEPVPGAPFVMIQRIRLGV